MKRIYFICFMSWILLNFTEMSAVMFLDTLLITEVSQYSWKLLINRQVEIAILAGSYAMPLLISPLFLSNYLLPFLGFFRSDTSIYGGSSLCSTTTDEPYSYPAVIGDSLDLSSCIDCQNQLNNGNGYGLTVLMIV